MDGVLGAIIESIDKTSHLVGEARPGDGRACRGRQEVLGWREMATLTRQIAGSVRENAAGAEEITLAAQKMNQLTHQMSEAVTEQKRGGRWW